MINPYSTAFARWWCRSGRYMRLSTMITGHQAAYARRPSSVRPSIPAHEMARRREAVDRVVADLADDDG